jgi:hypothetical protein
MPSFVGKRLHRRRLVPVLLSLALVPAFATQASPVLSVQSDETAPHRGSMPRAARPAVLPADATVAGVVISPSSGVTIRPGAQRTFTLSIAGAAVPATWNVSNLPTATAPNQIRVIPNRIATNDDGSATMTAGSTPGDFVVTATAADGEIVRAFVTVDAPADRGPAFTPSYGPAGGIFNSLRWSPRQPDQSVRAGWLYSRATAHLHKISDRIRAYHFHVYTHEGGWDFPVQYTYSAGDESHHQTCFTDTLRYSYTDRFCVPDPPGGYAPSTAGDGHLVVVDYANRQYWDFWELRVNSAGVPISTNVGQIKHGEYEIGSGSPGTTAAAISGLAGDILPGELDCVTCLNHALSLVVPARVNRFGYGRQGPVVHTDGHAATGVFIEGAKLFLDRHYDYRASGASVAVQAIMRALQLYGGLVTDQTGCPDCINAYSALATQPDLSGADLIVPHLEIAY